MALYRVSSVLNEHRDLTVLSEGSLTMGFGIICAFFLVSTISQREINGQPEYPHNARMLKPIERDLAVWRLEQESGAGEAHDESTGTWSGFKLAIKDPKVSSQRKLVVLICADLDADHHQLLLARSRFHHQFVSLFLGGVMELMMSASRP